MAGLKHDAKVCRQAAQKKAQAGNPLGLEEE